MEEQEIKKIKKEVDKKFFSSIIYIVYLISRAYLD